MPGAFFGPPGSQPQPGGAQLTVYLVPVYEGRLLVFDVSAKEARGRWLPWDVLPFGTNPYEFASELADEWCDGAVAALTLADIMSFPAPGHGWELAIVFRAELTAPPASVANRTPHLFPRGAFDAIGSFDPVDLERWVETAGPAPGKIHGGVPGDGPRGGLVF